ncbi:MAG TPA: response regulator [Nitrososphaeraceae archaeon]|nr:response regulator [Nitrososphaeraceae archaeon]
MDDEKDLCRTYELILESHGFEVDCFTDSAMVLEKFKPNVYDLIILDIKMPDPNGFKLYDQIKSRDSNIKTLFITALNSVEPYSIENKKVYPIKGQRHYVKKPLAMDELLEQVYSLLVPEEEYEEVI